MTNISKSIAIHYMFLVALGLWNDTMRRAVVRAKYKESLKWAKSS